MEDPDAGTTTTDGSSCAYSLTNETVKPFGFGSVNADGTVSAVEGNCDDPMPGFVYNNGTETGYLFSGLVGNSDKEEAIFLKVPTNEEEEDEETGDLVPIWDDGGYGYLFLLSDGTHTYAKFNALKNVIAPHAALKLGNLKATNPQKWWEIGEGHGVPMSGQVFSTVNYGAEWPWEEGNYYSYYEVRTPFEFVPVIEEQDSSAPEGTQPIQTPEGWRVPLGSTKYESGGEICALHGAHHYYYTTVKGHECFIIVDGSSPDNFLIIPYTYGSIFPWTAKPLEGIYLWSGAIVTWNTAWYFSLGATITYINEAYYNKKENADMFRCKFQVRLVPDI